MQEIIKLERLFEQNKITRRKFIQKLAALGVTVTLPLSLISKPAKAMTPKRGGRLRLGMKQGSASDSLDPATISNGNQWLLTRSITNTLTEIDTSHKLIPSLSKNWEASGDAATWTFELRKDVEFQNGRSLTAKDVIATMNYHRGPKSKSYLKPIVDVIKDVRADDKYTVVFTLNGGNADFPYNLDSTGLGIYPAAIDGSIDWKAGIGTGGYILEDYEPGVRAYLKRNPNYWKKNRAHFNEAEVFTIGDSSARTTALITNKVDVIDEVDPKTADMLAKKTGVHVEEKTGALHYTFPMFVDTPPFDNNNVRLALKFAIDREAMLKLILRGHGIVGNDHPIGPSYRFHATNLAQHSYDPDKSKYYLSKAGLKELNVDLSAADAAFFGAVDSAVLFKEHAAKASININVVRESNDGYWSSVWNKKPWSACYWGGYVVEDSMLTTQFTPGAAWNDTHWNNERFNKLLVEARAELNEAKRREMYVEMQRILRDEGGDIVPCFANAILARSDKVDHGEWSGIDALDGNRILERWWMA